MGIPRTGIVLLYNNDTGENMTVDVLYLSRVL